MKKKYLTIGINIIAVVLLVLGSLSNVVGYHSVKSTAMNESPLFSIRTNKATNNENNRVITSNYLGKGINTIQFPLRDSNGELIQKFIDRISTMDDATFIKFLENILHWLTTQDNNNDVDVQQLLISVNRIRENPKAYERHIVNYNNDFTTNGTYTVDRWFPGCYLYNGIAYILSALFLFLFIILFPTILNTFNCICNPNLR